MIADKIRNSEVANCIEQVRDERVTTTDELFQMCSAFQSLEDFAFSHDNHGYTPTLRPHPGRSNRQKVWNAAVVELAARLERAGYRVYRGMN